MNDSSLDIFGLLGELRRRHVFRVALVYAGVAWLTVQVSQAFFPPLQVPEWSLSLVTAMLILGFPIALVLAWAYDLTPTGVQRTRGRPTGKRRIAVERPSDAPQAVTDREAPLGRTLAALPFLNLTKDAEYQFLGDGVTDELITALARVEGIRVVSRTSSFALRETAADAREIGARLGVDYILEGTVRVSSERLRLSVQLVDVADGFAIWTETFGRRIEDLLRVQEEVAEAVVAALRARLSPAEAAEIRTDETRPLLRNTTDNVAAYTYYLRGRARLNERTPASLHRSIQHFDHAIRLDPRFAHAHAGLADSYAILLDHGLVSPADALPRMRQAAAQALDLDPELAESHSSSALVRQLEWRWDDAEVGFRRALEIDPTYSVARQRLALLLAWSGRFAESRAELDRAASSDPLSPIIAATRGWVEYYAGEFETAIAAAQETLADHPDLPSARIPLALALLAVGRAEESVMELERVATASGEPSPAVALLACALGRAGRGDEAQRQVERLRSRATHSFVSPYYLAVATLGIGDQLAALEALERAADERVPQLVYLSVEPLFAKLRPEPRFQRILGRVGLPPSGVDRATEEGDDQRRQGRASLGAGQTTR
jgi:TolB-like protein/Tfp pilus assembly protein PilF